MTLANIIFFCETGKFILTEILLGLVSTLVIIKCRKILRDL